jgi:hypothetical protein
MNTTRTGKIARLPRAIRDELNQRLYNGQKGRDLVAWLNTLPESQAAVGTEFAGKPIRPQNLSEWKQGGYRDWLLHQEALALAQHLAQDMTGPQAAVCSPPPPLEERAGQRRPSLSALPTPKSVPPLTDLLALWLAARYALATRTLAAQPGPEHWRRLRELCADVLELRRADHAAERLRLDRLRLNRQFNDRQTVHRHTPQKSL